MVAPTLDRKIIIGSNSNVLVPQIRFLYVIRDLL